MAEPVSWRRRLTGGSHLSASYALRWHTALAPGARWAGPGFLAWAKSVPPAFSIFLIFSFLFSLLFEFKNQLKASKKHNFEILSSLHTFYRNRRDEMVQGNN
jgi:hypothetical protein